MGNVKSIFVKIEVDGYEIFKSSLGKESYNDFKRWFAERSMQKSFPQMGTVLAEKSIEFLKSQPVESKAALYLVRRLYDYYDNPEGEIIEIGDGMRFKRTDFYVPYKSTYNEVQRDTELPEGTLVRVYMME